MEGLTYFILLVFFIIKFYYYIATRISDARLAGCAAIENMVMERAKECGYDTERLWQDLFQ